MKKQKQSGCGGEGFGGGGTGTQIVFMPKETKQIKIKAWIQTRIKPAVGVLCLPCVHDFELTPTEIKTSKEHGFAFYPCVITYNLDEKLK